MYYLRNRIEDMNRDADECSADVAGHAVHCVRAALERLYPGVEIRSEEIRSRWVETRRFLWAVCDVRWQGKQATVEVRIGETEGDYEAGLTFTREEALFRPASADESAPLPFDLPRLT